MLLVYQALAMYKLVQYILELRVELILLLLAQPQLDMQYLAQPI
jgi:hypothetical protein